MLLACILSLTRCQTRLSRAPALGASADTKELAHIWLTSCWVQACTSALLRACASRTTLNFLATHGSVPAPFRLDGGTASPTCFNLAQLCPNLVHLGPTLVQLRPNLVQLGSNLGPTWPNLAPIWVQVGVTLFKI